MRSLLHAILKSFGVAKVIEAQDGEAAIKMLERYEIDLIFCDWEMPRKTGLELFLDLSSKPEYANIPFVLVTSVAELDKVKQAIQKGIQHYIVKPFKEATILEKLNQIFPETSKT